MYIAQTVLSVIGCFKAVMVTILFLVQYFSLINVYFVWVHLHVLHSVFYILSDLYFASSRSVVVP